MGHAGVGWDDHVGVGGWGVSCRGGVWGGSCRVGWVIVG